MIGMDIDDSLTIMKGKVMNSLEMLIIVLGIASGLYIGYIILNQFIYFLTIVIHWWEDRKA